MISCSDFLTEIGNYLEGDVAAEVRAMLEEHLAHCQTCTVLVDSTRMTVKIMTECGSFDLPEHALRPIAARIMSKIRSAENPARKEGA